MKYCLDLNDTIIDHYEVKDNQIVVYFLSDGHTFIFPYTQENVDKINSIMEKQAQEYVEQLLKILNCNVLNKREFKWLLNSLLPDLFFNSSPLIAYGSVKSYIHYHLFPLYISMNFYIFINHSPFESIFFIEIIIFIYQKMTYTSIIIFDQTI